MDTHSPVSTATVSGQASAASGQLSCCRTTPRPWCGVSTARGGCACGGVPLPAAEPIGLPGAKPRLCHLSAPPTLGPCFSPLCSGSSTCEMLLGHRLGGMRTCAHGGGHVRDKRAESSIDDSYGLSPASFHEASVAEVHATHRRIKHESRVALAPVGELPLVLYGRLFFRKWPQQYFSSLWPSRTISHQ